MKMLGKNHGMAPSIFDEMRELVLEDMEQENQDGLVDGCGWFGKEDVLENVMLGAVREELEDIVFGKSATDGKARYDRKSLDALRAAWVAARAAQCMQGAHP